MNAHRTHPLARTGRRGAATVEFVLCIPLLALVLMLTFFFGWAMASQQHVRVADRYTAWRMIRGQARPTARQVNDSFFAGRGQQVDLDTWAWQSDTPGHYVGIAGSYDRQAGALADEVVIQQRLSQGLTARVEGNFPSDVSTWQRHTGAIRSRHTRPGVEWRRGQARCEPQVAEEFLGSLDAMLQRTAAPADRLAAMFRGLYLTGW